MIGLGLLEAIPEEAILANARPANKNAIAGRPNWVWDDACKRPYSGVLAGKPGNPTSINKMFTRFLVIWA